MVQVLGFGGFSDPMYWTVSASILLLHLTSAVLTLTMLALSLNEDPHEHAIEVCYRFVTAHCQWLFKAVMVAWFILNIWSGLAAVAAYIFGKVLFAMPTNLWVDRVLSRHGVRTQ